MSQYVVTNPYVYIVFHTSGYLDVRKECRHSVKPSGFSETTEQIQSNCQ